MGKQNGLSLCFLTGGMCTGGAERVIATLANIFTRQGHHVKILCMGRSKKQLGYELERKIEIVYTGGERGCFPVRKARQFRRILLLLKSYGPDILISFQNYINIQAVFLGKAAGIPVVVSERSFPGKNMDGIRGWSWLCKWAYSKADAVVYQTKEQREYFGLRNKQKSYIIMNPFQIPVDEIPEYTIRDEALILGSVGRLEASKNFQMLIRLIANLKNDFPSIRLVIWGEGSQKETLIGLSDELGVRDMVDFPGESRNILNEMEKMDIFLFSSRYEGIPNALIEAMCMGIPCISTRFEGGGAELLIQDRKNGLLVQHCLNN
ncbi:glycosyltransferase family 4 protein [Clostridiaceae bacterium]|nr:glycosyltransferase family 4 protein [Clostridiaceae bacterium]